MSHRITNSFFVALFFAAGACDGGDAAAPGMLDVAVYGESFIEEGIPADVFADDWSVQFDSFLISVGGIQAASGGMLVLEDPAYRIFDLSQGSGGSGFLALSEMVPGGAYDDVAYRIAPSDSAAAGNAAANDVLFMREQGYAIYVEGRATRGDQTRTFAWGLTTATTYERCRSVATVDGGRVASVLTIHADHLFYDDLISDEPDVRFDAIAGADADGDGDITAAELAAVDITGFERYQVGSFDVRDLWSFLDHQASTVGHIDGEGHCERITRE